ncbi:hypothetical protein AB0L22_08930 [Micromonospora haikouensis]|uniref:hypothetical protein n=1 Tax=Micromonospora haikouensis TaxID=686309 RepID=UPI003432F498
MKTMARPTKPQRVAIAERRAKNVALRMAGKSWAAIAAELDYGSPGAACQDFSRALEASIAEQHRSVELYREEELQRLDMLLAEAWAVLKRQHVTVSHGRVIRDEETDKPLIDDGPTLAAIDRVLKIQERRAKYLGLDAPTKVEAITIDALDAEIAKLAAELEADQAGEAAGVASAQG